MARLIVEIPNDKVQIVLDAMTAQYNYQATLPNPAYDPEIAEDPVTNPSTIDNPETRAKFVNRIVRQFIIENVKAYQKKVAAQAARQNVDNTFDVTLSEGV